MTERQLQMIIKGINWSGFLAGVLGISLIWFIVLTVHASFMRTDYIRTASYCVEIDQAGDLETLTACVYENYQRPKF